MNEFKILPASREHAPLIADAILMAVGEEITAEFAGSPERIPLVHRAFENLAAAEDSQYSYRNSLVALTPSGEVAGVIISYDGARLHQLRRAFYREAAATLGIEFEEDLPDETSPDEIYLDSLAVFEPFRGHGLAARLIDAAADFHKDDRKPLGLLVDPPNERAYSLYRKLGFKKVGQRPFADTMMDHLQLSR